MATTSDRGLGEWFESQSHSMYKSCIKINGLPILPPLMTDDRRAEMRLYRNKATDIENRLSGRRAINISDDAAGGEALYEGVNNELPIVTPVPNSVNKSAVCSDEVPNMEGFLSDKKEDDATKIAQDMLREFDPLAPEQQDTLSGCMSVSLNVPEDVSETAPISYELNDSKPSSADRSASLSNSTDLNQYMDVMESSSSESKASAETTSTTPSTLQQIDTARQCTSKSGLDGKTTYDDLNNYLDIILNNNSINCDANIYGKSRGGDICNVEHTLDKNHQQEQTHMSDVLVHCGTLRQDCDALKSISPKHLTEPLDNLQTNLLSSLFCSANLSVEELKNEPVSFLHECSLSPVLQDGLEGPFQENNFSQSTVPVSPNTKKSDNLSPEHGCSERSKLSFNPHHIIDKDAPTIEVEPAPRLVRSNSYTLDSPSPLLLAHMEAELRKTSTKNDVSFKPLTQCKTRSNLCPGRPRRVWDMEKAVNSPNWYRKQNLANANHLKKDSCVRIPKKVDIKNSSSVRVAGLAAASASVETRTASAEFASTNCSIDDSTTVNNELMLVSSVEESEQVHNCNKENLSLALAKLQLQHTKEVEELLSRQEKEKEAIRLILSKEQASLVRKSTTDPIHCAASNLNEKADDSKLSRFQEFKVNQSPPSKDKTFTERRNTSPSVFDDSSVELQRCFLFLNKSTSMNDMLNENGCSVDLNSEQRAGFLQNSQSGSKPPNMLSFKSLHGQNSDKIMCKSQSPTHSTVDNFTSYVTTETGSVGFDGSTSISFATNMFSSFPSSQLQKSHQNLSMVACLPKSSLDFLVPLPQNTAGQSQLLSSDASSSPSPIKSSAVHVSHTSTMQEASRSHNKRKSWCSRQLFRAECGDEKWQDSNFAMESQELLKHAAAARIQAGVRGYLTRRLLRTERVQNCITTIRDTIVCAIQLEKECAPHVEASDLQLHGRLIQQLSGACEELHNIFLGLSVSKRMAIISADRMRLLAHSSRSSSSAAGSRPLSRATQIVLQRKLNQSYPIDKINGRLITSGRNRSRRRSWAMVDTRAQLPPATASAPTSARHRQREPEAS